MTRLVLRHPIPYQDDFPTGFPRNSIDAGGEPFASFHRHGRLQIRSAATNPSTVSTLAAFSQAECAEHGVSGVVIIDGTLGSGNPVLIDSYDILRVVRALSAAVGTLHNSPGPGVGLECVGEMRPICFMIAACCKTSCSMVEVAIVSTFGGNFTVQTFVKKAYRRLQNPGFHNVMDIITLNGTLQG